MAMASTISDQELQFISQWTKESDVAKLRTHVLEHWKRMQESSDHLYGCMKSRNYLEPRINKFPAYQRLLKRIATENLKFLEIGCAFGTDVRQVLLDGWPAENILAIDIVDTYWQFGLDLFLDKTHPPPIQTLWADIIDDAVFDPTKVPSTPTNPVIGEQFLNGRIDGAFAGAVLHVLSAETVRALLQKVFAALAPGATFFGISLGITGTDDSFPWGVTPDGKGDKRVLHSSGSLKNLAREVGFADCITLEVPRPASLDTQEGSIWQDGELELMESKGITRVFVGFEMRK
ncbi:hypothetical protein M427DRAFT_27425 [Gonapodya prolifera JEL478]|uniref:Methyltransferase domain-containing protein n=1 Tax=Gonapodya prolifera (strain JEL478) TaxID=1344416 RepID=A0A139AYU3_GONPJ|nr:hypothetical protein M427DRAFT_27425 [Gonapodya prolifera JEL478]|eukprot:KXS21874.1 hypothetical protein M427DRAFT_27425 [Gonapodya prolifera JEL478]